MKFSLSWLRTHLATEATLDRMTDTLSAIGLEVEGVENPGATLAPFRTARIVEAVPHPNADRLRVCQVDAGTGALISVVCGAPNARTGLHVVFGPPGAYVPGSAITLKVGEIRGVTSAGMLVSTRELGLGEDHDGIIELPEGTAIGQSYAVWADLDDPIIEIGVTPNRGDALSVRGVARDLAACGLGVLKAWAPVPVPAAFDTPLGWSINWPHACPWILGRSIRGVTNGPSPVWLQRRLTSAGLRPISALVDITNFFTVDLGRPLHVFDADKIAGTTLTLARGDGAVLRALNGRDIVTGADDLVITDAAGPVSLAGIMGGAESGTSEATRHVFLECAIFDPVITARTGRRHQLNSDARARFDRGVDQALPPAAMDAATRMILDLCGGEAGSIVTAGSEPAWQRTASLRFERIAGLGGAAVSADDAARILDRLGFAARTRDAAQITVSVPPWRNDVAGRAGLDQPATLDAARAATASEGAALIEPECDLLEEVLRIAGLNDITPVSLPLATSIPARTLSPRQARTALARRTLAARGFAECVTYSFMPRDKAALFGPACGALTLKNPIAADLDQMRPTPLATIALAASRNLARGAGHVALFETAPGYGETGQTLIAAAVRAGTPPRYFAPQPGFADALALKAELWALLACLGVPLEALSVTVDAPSHYHPGQSGCVRQGPKILLAQFGTMHPSVAASLDLPPQTAGLELFLDAIADPKRRRRAAPLIPALQPVSRDFAFVVPVATSADSVLRAARGADRTLIARVGLFDVYEGAHVGEGQKSLGIEVVLQPAERSLTDADIEVLSAKIVAAVGKATGGVLR